MPTKEDILRLRGSTNDRAIFSRFFDTDSSFRKAVENVQEANPDMGALEQAKFKSTMLDIHYGIKMPKPVPDTTVSATRAMETEQPPEGFFTRVAGDIRERGERFGEGFERDRELVPTALQLTGETIGGAFDVLGETLVSGGRVLSAITPDILEEPIVEGVKTTGQFLTDTQTGQAVLNAIQQGADIFEELQKTNPELAENLRAIANIASILPAERALGFAKGAGKVGRTLEESGEASLRAQKKSFIERLVSPIRTKKVKEAQVPRQREIGFRKKTVTKPTRQETRAAEALIDIETLSPRRTTQFNFNAIQDANIAEAKTLKTLLSENDFNFPRKELNAVLEKSKEKLKANPAIVGDAEKTADKLIAEINRRVKEAPAKGSSLLQVRKDFDQWVKSQKGANIFDPNRENAFSLANREIRDSINNFIDVKAINVDVKSSLAKQTSLFNAMEIIVPKAAQEADTAFLRTLQKVGKVLGVKSRIVQGLAALIGIGGLGAAAAFAPPVAVIGGLGLLTFKGGKLILNPKVRILLGKTIRELEKTGAIAEITAIREFLNGIEE